MKRLTPPSQMAAACQPEPDLDMMDLRDAPRRYGMILAKGCLRYAHEFARLRDWRGVWYFLRRAVQYAVFPRREIWASLIEQLTLKDAMLERAQRHEVLLELDLEAVPLEDGVSLYVSSTVEPDINVAATIEVERAHPLWRHARRHGTVRAIVAPVPGARDVMVGEEQ